MCVGETGGKGEHLEERGNVDRVLPHYCTRTTRASNDTCSSATTACQKRFLYQLACGCCEPQCVIPYRGLEHFLNLDKDPCGFHDVKYAHTVSGPGLYDG